MFFGLFGNKRVKKLEDETKKSFQAVKGDFDRVGVWIKHLDEQDKQVFDILGQLKSDISTIKDELEGLRDAVEIIGSSKKIKQVSKNEAVYIKQLGVDSVQKPVQTAVQTGNFHQILNGLSSNERLLVFTLMNSELKLSYEDLARLLGKERSTIRGQINSIKQKSEGLIREIREPNGKKRVFVEEEIKEKLVKYAKVRVGKGKKLGKKKKK
ncbi:hypothetical protein COU62_04270 [Candidatus Pacearchaeota archaeon CG10_big_fil_rev_8_21_14_0_10_35_219]|nr:hypothetical protein [Candidatus Pacearchaeota archaeon]OIO42206.1 MAG: hypothetical protein AUJ63_02905 [Candidatus Pacearchaeota archaeon CG1_02_35_32]PIO07326.1 MAG: hypothetical protein COU62_04270 [Candidatus Pacearchaeota archaeon CG10_big_fil_rev_8_21_14_0_10_35_219]PIY81376.1 MAG: hypothetical protein COY79_03815 [Candidatus Pacearchaeota archaeon CG_4_10_14_0_8_um_filter_35_169]PIZ79832.1 MAG: hypothetical protein COY00_03320 [Candidatus Pacearchaeota archaeon CG_4_10_14_0_2_um_filt